MGGLRGYSFPIATLPLDPPLYLQTTSIARPSYIYASSRECRHLEELHNVFTRALYLALSPLTNCPEENERLLVV